MNENDGELSPILTLDKPSPCCLNIYAELTDVTATGEFCLVIIQIDKVCLDFIYY